MCTVAPSRRLLDTAIIVAHVRMRAKPDGSAACAFGSCGTSLPVLTAANTYRWRRACRWYRLSSREFGNCGKSDVISAAIDRFDVVSNVLDPPPRNRIPRAMWIAMCEPYDVCRGDEHSGV